MVAGRLQRGYCFFYGRFIFLDRKVGTNKNKVSPDSIVKLWYLHMTANMRHMKVCLHHHHYQAHRGCCKDTWMYSGVRTQSLCISTEWKAIKYKSFYLSWLLNLIYWHLWVKFLVISVYMAAWQTPHNAVGHVSLFLIIWLITCTSSEGDASIGKLLQKSWAT